MSNDHKHEFLIAFGLGKGIIFCRIKDCGYEISPSEAVRRMNATECLSAEDAIDCSGVYHNMDQYYGTMDEKLEAYAQALEDKE